MTIIKPQPKQIEFLSSPADIVIYGGAAGGGKSWSLLYEPLRHVDVPRFGAVIFRRNANQIINEGGLWDASMEMYLKYPGARPKKTPAPYWQFPSGAKVSFRHLERDDSVHKWQGTEICLLEFDELTHFSEKQFFYMLSRNRSTCGVRPYCRCSCNPDADSWVKDFIAWWIDQDTGYAIPERSGVIRYMARVNEELVWGDSVEEVLEIVENADYDVEIKAEDIKSVTFILSTLEDNQVLMQADPGYMANLKALSIVERERLLRGNWKIKAAKGLFFQRTQVRAMLEKVPDDVIKWVRAWDLAATDEDENGDPAYTASVLIGKRRSGGYVVANVTNNRLKAAKVREQVKTCAVMDKKKYKRVTIRMNQDPGQAGKEQAESYIKFLAGFHVSIERETGTKESRAEPFATQWQNGNVDVVVGEWNEMYFGQLEAFPESKFKDMVDASSTAFNELEKMNTSAPPPKTTALTKESYWR
jgi:predicted phage terminase large subunit-like protein